MKRIYEDIIWTQLSQHDLMAFVSGPRQVGKTTLIQHLNKVNKDLTYLNWDNLEHREIILAGPSKVIQAMNIDSAPIHKPLLALDEIHKWNQWQTFVKGLYDTYKNNICIVVTGSARLNVYRRGGDSMMGRYFLYRTHPLTVGELVRNTRKKCLIEHPKPLNNTMWKALMQHGGFPKPFLTNDNHFSQQWQQLKHQQFLHEDIKSLADISRIAQLEVLASLLNKQIGQLTNYSSLAKKIRTSDVTVRNWLNLLEELYYCFKIHPWSKNVTRSLLKNPKYYLWDWSTIQDKGTRVENFVASHLLKATHFWTDTGLGSYNLHFVRDKDKQEVDFLITENNKPYMLIEVKSSKSDPLSKYLKKFSDQLQPKYSFQLAFDMPFQDFDVRNLTSPKIIPMISFLSQLV